MQATCVILMTLHLLVNILIHTPCGGSLHKLWWYSRPKTLPTPQAMNACIFLSTKDDRSGLVIILGSLIALSTLACVFPVYRVLSIPIYGTDWAAGLTLFPLSQSCLCVAVLAPIVELHLLSTGFSL